MLRTPRPRTGRRVSTRFPRRRGRDRRLFDRHRRPRVPGWVEEQDLLSSKRAERDAARSPLARGEAGCVSTRFANERQKRTRRAQPPERLEHECVSLLTGVIRDCEQERNIRRDTVVSAKAGGRRRFELLGCGAVRDQGRAFDPVPVDELRVSIGVRSGGRSCRTGRAIRGETRSTARSSGGPGLKSHRWRGLWRTGVPRERGRRGRSPIAGPHS